MELDLKARLIFAFHHPVLAALQGEKGSGGEKRSFVLRSTSKSRWLVYSPARHLFSLCTPGVADLHQAPGSQGVCVCGARASVRR